MAASRPRRSFRVWITGALALAAAFAWFQSSRADTEPKADYETGFVTIPRGKGLPVVIRAAVQFVDVGEIDENAGTFAGTVDVRLRWQDVRQRNPGAPDVEVRGEEADALLETVWFPDVAIANMTGEPEFTEKGLTLDADGNLELMQRTKGTFQTAFEVSKFPFDRQRLDVKLAVRGETLDKVALDYRKDDVAFSKATRGVDLESWTPGVVDLQREPVPGWYGRSHAGVVAGLWVERRWEGFLAAVFIPLLSSLLIPLLALWLQKVDDEGNFEVDAFELANIVIGGLFAVIALNFTLNSEYSALASGDNTVTRLFGLNYLALALSLGINISMFKYGVLGRLFGKYVQEQVYYCIAWGIPTLVLGSVVAFFLVAMA